MEKLSKIADRELSRTTAIERHLDFISRQLGHLQIVDTLPDVSISSQSLVNTAIDVRSAVLRYLAIQIRNESSRMGIVGIDEVYSANFRKSSNRSIIRGRGNPSSEKPRDLNSKIQRCTSPLWPWRRLQNLRTSRRLVPRYQLTKTSVVISRLSS